MGWNQETRTLVAYVGRHNSPEDAEHDALFDELCARIAEIVGEEKYAPIAPWFD